MTAGKRRLSTGALGIAAMLLAGCTAGPDYRRPEGAATVPFVPMADVSAQPPIIRWWREFHDDDLDWLVDTALRDNPDLASAEALVRRARAAAGIAGASRLPAVNASARVSDDKLSRNGENLALIPITPKTTEFTDYRVGVDASWEIDLAGRSRRELEAAIARLGSAEETRHDAMLVVASEVASTYVDLRVAEARLAVARQRSADAEESRRLVGLARAAGVVGDDDLRRAEADVANATALAAPHEAAVDGSVFALAALTGLRADEIRTRVAGHAGIPHAPSSIPVGLPADVLKRRPDVRRAERDLAASTAEVGAAIAAQFPRLVLVADGGLDSIRAGDLGAAASRYWNIAPQLTLPLFSGGRLRNQVRQAEASRDASLAAYRGRVLKALADAESALVRFGAARTRKAAADQLATAMQGNVEAAARRFGSGDSSRIDLLAANRAADDARDQQLSSEGDLARAFVALNKSLGGGWQADPATSAR